ncbi:MAG TPA: (d)CMP kinase [Firmicutes bacterium]|nr:(d)CMP kinase [Bacillota bacterium]
MQIAIDGPAGAGKSTVAKLVAERLGFIYIDTGAMYRALTYLVLQKDADPYDEENVYTIQQEMDLQLLPAADATSCRVLVNGEDVSEKIRHPDVGKAVSVVSSHGRVRWAMVALQQELASGCNVVMDGRDIGTTVLPKAELKIFLSASVEERAKRRLAELVQKGHRLTLEAVIADIKKRDHIDSTRAISPLRMAEDAVEIDTTDLSVDQVVEEILALVVRRENRV